MLSVDCRRLFAALLKRQLGLRSNEALAGTFVTPGLFRS